MSRLVFDCTHRFDSGFELDAQFDVVGGVVGLVGPSGAGKTTIARMIAGLVRPRRGKIRVGDHVVTDTQSNRHVPAERRKIGMLFQDQNLFPHLTVRRNLEYGLRRRGGDKRELARAVEAMEIGDLLDRWPRTLSGGQQQRVALARAIASGPEWLLLDEPLTAVEMDLRERIMDYLEKMIRQFEIPTLLISHQGAMVERLADQLVEVESGRVVSPR